MPSPPAAACNRGKQSGADCISGRSESLGPEPRDRRFKSYRPDHFQQRQRGAEMLPSSFTCLENRQPPFLLHEPRGLRQQRAPIKDSREDLSPPAEFFEYHGAGIEAGSESAVNDYRMRE